jgi:hypothetical protein
LGPGFNETLENLPVDGVMGLGWTSTYGYDKSPISAIFDAVNDRNFVYTLWLGELVAFTIL